MRGSLGAEFNQMAHELAEFGKRCADAGRDWLNDRRNEMNRDPQGRNYGRDTRGQQAGTRYWSQREDEGRVHYGGPDTPRSQPGYRGQERYTSAGPSPEGWHENRFDDSYSPRSGYDMGYGGPGGYGPQSQSASQRDFGRGYGGSDYREETYGSYGRSEPYRSQASGMPTWESERSMDTVGAAQRGYGYGDYRSEGQERRQQYGAYASHWDQGAEGLHGFRGRGPKNYSRSDERIREDVCERLLDADDIDASAVSVAVNQGMVTLDGEVSHRCMKHWAEDLAESCSGVRDVDNRLRVQPRESQAGSQSRFSPTGTEQRAQGQTYGQERTTGSPGTTTDTESSRH